MSDHPPIVILTALELEYKAVRDRLSGIREPPPAAGTRFEVGSLGDGEVVLAVTGQGNHGTAVLAERAIRVFSPGAVLFVGVAGALTDSVRLGDIVVATHVYAYHGGAARTGGPASRPRVWEIDHALEQTARRLARRDDDGPAIHFGPVASGEILHDARVSEPLRWIREHYDDALAIEMEAAGVARAGHLSSVPVAVVRAISGRADGTQAGGDDAGWQPRAVADAGSFAVANAASFAVALAGELITQRRTGRDAGPTKHDVRVRTKGGRHGAVAGILGGGVHNHNTRPGRSSGPGREE